MSSDASLNRLEHIRHTIDSILLAQADEEYRRCGFVHLYGVSALCVLLAERRNLDRELCALAGMLHDIASYETGDPQDHAHRSAIRARQLLAEAGIFTPEEIAWVTDAIARHSDKIAVDDPLAEVLKDADVLQHYLYNPELSGTWPDRPRSQQLSVEFGIGQRGNTHQEEPCSDMG